MGVGQPVGSASDWGQEAAREVVQPGKSGVEGSRGEAQALEEVTRGLW